MSDAGVPPVPEALLAPLLDTAADHLRALEPGDVPLSLRPLTGFDRRGLSRGAARQQLLRAIESEEGFRKEMVERFLERAEVEDVLGRWNPSDAVGLVDAAAERDDLPLLASALYAARPDGWNFGVGIAVATYERRRREQAADDDVKALRAQVAALEEARRRADTARSESDANAQRLDRELRDERRSRRAREEEAQRHTDVARRRAESLERELAAAREETQAAEARHRREVSRVRAAEADARAAHQEVARLESELAELAERSVREPGVLGAAERQALEDAAELARRVADGLGVLATRHRDASGASDAAGPAPARQDTSRGGGRGRDGGRTRPAPPAVPKGLVADSPEGVNAMLHVPGVVMVVDGYNVSMQGWPDAPPDLQRERLLAALTELQMRMRCGVVCVFDGADVGSVPAPRRTGVRVVFSEPGEDADPVVVRQVASFVRRAAPVLAVSSDHWVRDHAEAQGARVVGARALLQVLRG